MKWTIGRKLLMLYAMIGVLGFLLLSSLGSYLIMQRLIIRTSQNLYHEATLIAEDQKNLYYRNESSLKTAYDELSELASYEDAEIWLLDAEGTCYINTGITFNAEKQDTIKGFDPVALGTDYYSVGTFFDSFREDVISVLVPISSKMTIKGYVAIHIPVSTLETQREHMLGVMDLMFLFLYLLILAFLIFTYYAIIRPVRKIVNGAREYAGGNLDHKISIASQDELGDLAATLNFMAGELKKSEDYQRKFIANVSHDFRSPLTSIKGYAEAIQDGTIPPELMGKYLGIVVRETERLNKLTRNLLDLNDLDSKNKQNMLDLTVFDLNTVIKNTAATFEGICTQKHISISLILSGKQLYVKADIGKIQQVLYNLLDNAIKFSDHDKTITIETTVKNDKVFVSVKDMGCGISRESLPHVFDRFFKEDASRGRDRKGSGLGLSIVKEAINAHGENISVVSTLGVGTEFTFTLPWIEEPQKKKDILS